MTVTGRDVVERLRERVALCEGSIHPASAWYREDIPALLAVVEAAQTIKRWCDLGGTSDGRISVADLLFELEGPLAALHSQASDEGKASDG